MKNFLIGQISLDLTYEKMQKYKVEILKEVELSLNEIMDYIFRFTFSQESVDKLYKEVITSIYSLQIFPYRFVEYKNNFRIIIIRKKYRVFYKIDENNKKVTVYRILSSLQNYDNLTYPLNQ